MPNARTVLFDEQLDRGQVLEGVSASRLKVDNCRTEAGPPDSMRPTIRNCVFKDVHVTSSFVMGAVIDDVVLDTAKMGTSSWFLRANQFTHVTFRGKISGLILDTRPWELADNELVESYTKKLREAEDEADWTADISEAVGHIEVRGYNIDKFRINSAHQARVHWAELIDGRWREIDMGETAFGISLGQVTQYGWMGTILSANPDSKRFEDELRVIQELRSRGIAA